jgi:predicted short-subunit dehydrogenase-like oxidoreductase (DUF2520 family)
MDTDNAPKIVMIGAGRLAWHLGPALSGAGYRILQVYSRTEKSARKLGELIGTEWTTDPGLLDTECDMLLFCLPDRAIKEFPCFIELKKKVMMVHTAGSVPMEIFKGIAGRYGVFYPMMTFSKERSVDFNSIPVCIEGSDPEITGILKDMGNSLSDQVVEMESLKRKYLHMAGIIANNFSNHFYHLAEKILHAEGLDFNLIAPLILETAAKAVQIGPAAAQTGPASRNDTGIIEQHSELLKDHPELQKLYTFVSGSITNISKLHE